MALLGFEPNSYQLSSAVVAIESLAQDAILLLINYLFLIYYKIYNKYKDTLIIFLDTLIIF